MKITDGLEDLDANVYGRTAATTAKEVRRGISLKIQFLDMDEMEQPLRTTQKDKCPCPLVHDNSNNHCPSPGDVPFDERHCIQ